MDKFINLATRLFPLWVIVFSIWAYFDSQTWTALQTFVIPLLSIVMFSMGLTLKTKDFYRIFKNFKIILLGIFLQFLLMPGIGYFLISIFDLETVIAIGILLVGTAPGGTASNVICYLAKGDIALSISLTTCSTFLAVFFMPTLFWLYTGTDIDVPILQMMLSIFKIIILPVTLGVILNSLNLKFLNKIKNALPLIAITAIVIIIATIIGSSSDQILIYGWLILLIVIFHNLLGFIFGYYSCYLLNLDKKTSRTIAIEVAMQNSGLATALAIKYFGVISAIPAAFYSVWHNISGSLIASLWKKNTK